MSILKSKNLQHEFPHVDEGVQVLKERFQKKKVLILLDDVDRKNQIKNQLKKEVLREETVGTSFSVYYEKSWRSAVGAPKARSS